MTAANQALLSLGASASAQSVFSGYVADNAIDGNDTTRWHSNTVDYAQQWIVIDLGVPKAISEVRYLTDALNHAPSTVILESSNNGTEWASLATFSPGVIDYVLALSATRTARYFKFRGGVGGIASWRMFSIELRGGPAMTDGPLPDYNPVPPVFADCPSIAAWLTGIDTYYKPCVEAWLDANGY